MDKLDIAVHVHSFPVLGISTYGDPRHFNIHNVVDMSFVYFLVYDGETASVVLHNIHSLSAGLLWSLDPSCLPIS